MIRSFRSLFLIVVLLLPSFSYAQLGATLGKARILEYAVCLALMQQGFERVSSRDLLPPLPTEGDVPQVFTYYPGQGFYFPGGSTGSARGVIFLNGTRYSFQGQTRGKLHGTQTGDNSYYLTGIVRLRVYSGIPAELGQIAFAFNSAYEEMGDQPFPIQADTRILPVVYNQGKGALMSSFDMYKSPGRSIQLNDSFMYPSNPPDTTNQCQTALRIAQGMEFGSGGQSFGKVFNVTLAIPNNVQTYSQLATYDYDEGGEIDIHEWASNRNRMDSSDDSPNCENSIPSPGEPKKTTEVEVGPETRDKYKAQAEQNLEAAVGDGTSLGDPTINQFYIQAPSYDPADGLDKIDDFEYAIESKLSSQSDYQNLKELTKPLTSKNLPSFKLPKSEISLSTGTRSGTTSVEIDMSDVSIDFGSLENQSEIWQLIRIARGVLALSIFFFTLWSVWKLFASLLSTGSLGAGGSADD